MFAGFSDPFEALLALQRALDARVASDWMGRGTAAIGSFPPINIFQKDDDLVAVVELPGVDKNDLRRALALARRHFDDALDAVACGLRLVGDNGDLLADQRVQQR